LTYTTGVEENDKPFEPTFPYLAAPWSGTEVDFSDQKPE
jgi:hypothetical protein